MNEGNLNSKQFPARSKVHYMGSRGVERGACGKYIPAVHRPQDAAAWSPNKEEVTCKGCLNRMQA